MILSFADKSTKKIWHREYTKKFSKELCNKAYRKLVMIHSAVKLDDLRIPPGNKLHLLSGNRKGQYSISINNQWRICFNWEKSNAVNVEIVDYH
jgi:proteic killer suppression protein